MTKTITIGIVSKKPKTITKIVKDLKTIKSLYKLEFNDILLLKDYQKLKDALDTCNLIITDIAKPTRDSSIAIGTAQLKKIPIIGLFKINLGLKKIVSAFIPQKNVIFYSNYKELMQILEKKILNLAQDTRKKDLEPNLENNFKKHIYTQNKTKMTYFTGGNGPNLLFIHGIGGRAKTYKDILLKLANYFKVIAVDLPYFGESDIPHGVWYYKDFGKYLTSFIKYLNLKNLYIMGHSFGGSIALEIDRQKAVYNLTSFNITKLILINSAGLKIDMSHPKIIYKFWIKKTLQDKAYHKSKTFIDAGLDFSFALLKNLNRKDDIFRLKEMYMYLTKGNPNFENFITDTPGFVIWSKNDEIFDYKYTIRFLTHFNYLNFKLVDGNHDWPIFEPEKLIKIVKKYVIL